MNIELINKLYQLRYFKIDDIEFSWIDHEETWIISTNNDHVYGYMDNPYSIVLFKLAYNDGTIEEITEEIPLKGEFVIEEIANTIAEINNKIAMINSY